ncbi:tetratricopeptide repeat protein [Moheibacter sediminis]|uniref:Tetratricopeptide repeat-containing protein n=1 Tax=Moheibacter sediminis TaxID=1434700 RepID=A0A1W2C8D0_9FLAO|nr:tetratricopeptide repeat protein [Moheibacter sediminis]SMC81537.1 Tetratricopeptide repeat-containing protein [Moheibacter sediminis]
MKDFKLMCFAFVLFSGVLYSQTEQQVYNYFKGISKEKGFEKLDSLINMSNKKEDVIYLKALVASNVYDDYEVAILSYEQYLEVISDTLSNSMVYLNLCKNYYKIGQTEKAQQFLKKAEEINPENPYILHELGYMIDEYTPENLEIQYKYYEKALQNAYKFEYSKKDKFLEPMILGNIGFNLYHQKRTEESEAYLLQSVSIKEDKNVFNNLANTYQRLGKYDKALQYYNKTLSIDPKYLYAINGKANTYFRQGDKEMACKFWEEALKSGYEYQDEWNAQYDIENPKTLVEKHCNKK